ncbi:MAG: tetratricopeptide repeat protein [Verrucomicrobia bacterium]|nr:tetratricopeptide repeat protein [Verrucomicrobiota bacterium]
MKPITVSTNSLTKFPESKTSLDLSRWLLILLVVQFGPVARLSAEPENLSALLQKADRLDDTDRYSEALTILKGLEKGDPRNVEVLYRISRVESDFIDDLPDDTKKKGHDYAVESMAYAKRAIEADPQSSEAHLAAAIAYGVMTDFVDDRTKMEYSKFIKDETEKAIELDPRNDYAYLVLARWNFEMTQLNPILKGIAELLYGQMPPASQEKALDDFQKAIELAPNKMIHHFCYGEALAKLGRKDEARAEYQKVLRITPTCREERGYQQKAASGLKTLGR